MEETNGMAGQAEEQAVAHEALDKIGKMVEEEISKTPEEDFDKDQSVDEKIFEEMKRQAEEYPSTSQTPSSAAIPDPVDDGTGSSSKEEPVPLTEEQKKIQRQNILHALMSMGMNNAWSRQRPRKEISDAERAKRKKANKVAKASRKQNRKNRK